MSWLSFYMIYKTWQDIWHCMLWTWQTVSEQINEYWNSAIKKKFTRTFPYEKMNLSPNFLHGTYFFCMSRVSPVLWLYDRSHSFGNLLLASKICCKHYYPKMYGFDLASTWGLKSKSRKFSLLLRPYLAIKKKKKKKWILSECSSLYSAIRLPHSSFFSTHSTQAQADAVLMFLTVPCMTPASSASAICASVFTPVMN